MPWRVLRVAGCRSGQALGQNLMKLSIIILNYKNKNLVKYFLKNLVDFNFAWLWEIFVVDNASGDGIQKMIRREFPVVKFLANSKNLGMGAGNNVAIKNSKGEYILIVNPDVTLNQSAVQRLVEFLDHHPKAAIAAPQILNPNKSRQDTCYRWPNFYTFLYRRTGLARTNKGRKHLYYYLYRDIDLNQNQQVDWVLGGCVLVRRKALDEVGLFDERFFLFLEDTDLCRRMWQKNWQTWYVPAAKVIHLPHRLSAGSGSIKDLFSPLTWIHITSWLKYFWKWRRDKGNQADKLRLLASHS
jgi:N-acetylglucosaminyl-diphospho-decaprenol L-rhamnosyltransferase